MVIIAVDQRISAAASAVQEESNRSDPVAGNSSSPDQRIIKTGIIEKGSSRRETSPYHIAF